LYRYNRQIKVLAKTILIIQQIKEMETLTDFQSQLNRIEAAALGQKNVLSFNEACMYSGMSKSHLYKLTSGRVVPFYKPANKLIYFERVELEKWLLQNRVTTNAEIEQQAANYFKERGAAL